MNNFFRELVKNPALMAALVAFNEPCQAPARLKIDWAQPDRTSGQVQDQEGRLQAFIEAELRKKPSLRRFFPSPPGPEDFWDFGPEPLRLALLNEADFDQLALRFGAAVWGQVLAQVVEAKTVRALKANLGPDLLDWAIERGRFWLGDLGDFYRQKAWLPNDRPGLRLTGLRAINLAWSPLPAPLAARLGHRLMAEPDFGSDWSQSLAERTFARLKHLLLTEVAPSWRPCFS
ncbi:MAG: Yop proteins translocation protein K [Deltaproteobacteria bacterium]|jgi:hypothetical protein|nr:Yop proteins translocation protein K [Deltaproteobacteria bacterium]